jgi:hypothetical protein
LVTSLRVPRPPAPTSDAGGRGANPAPNTHSSLTRPIWTGCRVSTRFSTHRSARVQSHLPSASNLLILLLFVLMRLAAAKPNFAEPVGAEEPTAQPRRERRRSSCSPPA